jgi:hypothetical protein
LFHEGHRLGTHHRGQHAQHRAEIADDQARPVCRVFVALRAGFFHGITGASACAARRTVAATFGSVLPFEIERYLKENPMLKGWFG